MTDSERQQILKMIEDGKITAEEGLKLMQAIGESESEEATVETSGVEETPQPPSPPDPVVERLKRLVRSFYIIPLMGGIFVTVLTAWLMYQAVAASQMGIAFYCLMLPTLLFGILLLIFGAASQSSRWIYVDVKQKPGKRPGRILIGFPLNLVGWLIGMFGGHIPSAEREKVDMVMQVINDTTRTDPVVVQVDEGPNGDRVHVYIG